MPVDIAMLRGINVGPHKRMKMEKLRSSCDALGFAKVKTYIQSGNLVFQAPKLSSAAAAKKVEAQIVKDFGFSADVISRTAEEMKKVVEGNPLLREPGLTRRNFMWCFWLKLPRPRRSRKWKSSPCRPTKSVTPAKKSTFIFRMAFQEAASGNTIWIALCRSLG